MGGIAAQDAVRGAPDARGGPPEAIADVLRRMMGGVRPQRRRAGVAAVAWERAAGPDLVGETRPVGVRHGVLVVEVRSSALLADLQGFRQAEILARLLEAEPSGRLTGLRFRLGVF